ncbi:MAG: tetratricopeptide repeat protein, partial [Bacteroidales bacterium]|nr:tetratricopeptide repeat protein [Bacteroidales bacterium]
SEQHLIKSISYQKNINYNYLYYSGLFYLGKTYFLLQKHLEAIRTFNKIIKLSKNNNNHRYLIYCYNTLGKIYYEKKQIKQAVDNFILSIEYSIEQNNNIIPADSSKYLGLLYKRLNEPELAHHYFSESLKFYNIYTKNHKNINLSKELELIKKELFLIK